jgi:hypothetical protein
MRGAPPSAATVGGCRAVTMPAAGIPAAAAISATGTLSPTISGCGAAMVMRPGAISIATIPAGTSKRSAAGRSWPAST